MDRKTELAALLHIPVKQARAADIKAQMTDPQFWVDHEKAGKLSQELSHLEDLLTRYELAEQPKDFDELEEEVAFNGPHDDASAFLSVHAGAGGTEAQDWASMLLRMYQRYGEKAGYKVTLLDESKGEEVGIKSATLQINGFRAYGKLKSESGVHRLVRISPFDADKARHTSFALVEVVPEVEKSEYAIDPKDLKIDVYRAGGHGGQGVNTTDSAVRITHLPSKIVVTCQNERSQLQNKMQAMKILLGKLQLLDDEKRRISEQNIKGEPILAAWGNQIRSYVLQPYQLVKDNRTGFETAAVDKVLDGELNGLIEAYVKHQIINKK
ncbi:MAG TPA: peptide chain release factor 2 [Candidatus Saccharimonadales bacterium]|nr:peptide chain release factor 2 [Candidatus Saccharimonadales bacterium]